MPKEDTIKLDGVVEELLPNMHFRVTLQNGVKVIAHLCGIVATTDTLNAVSVAWEPRPPPADLPADDELVLSEHITVSDK